MTLKVSTSKFSFWQRRFCDDLHIIESNRLWTTSALFVVVVTCVCCIHCWYVETSTQPLSQVWSVVWWHLTLTPRTSVSSADNMSWVSWSLHCLLLLHCSSSAPSLDTDLKEEEIRIVNGQEAPVGALPYQASLQLKYDWLNTKSIWIACIQGSVTDWSLVSQLTSVVEHSYLNHGSSPPHTVSRVREPPVSRLLEEQMTSLMIRVLPSPWRRSSWTTTTMWPSSMTLLCWDWTPRPMTWRGGVPRVTPPEQSTCVRSPGHHRAATAQCLAGVTWRARAVVCRTCWGRWRWGCCTMISAPRCWVATPGTPAGRQCCVLEERTRCVSVRKYFSRKYLYISGRLSGWLRWTTGVSGWWWRTMLGWCCQLGCGMCHRGYTRSLHQC